MSNAASPLPAWLRDCPRYAALELDGLTLVLPQREVHTLESLLDVQPHPEEGDAFAGSITLAGSRWPVGCLGEDLAPLRPVPPRRRVCVMLAAPDGLFGLACSSVATIDARLLELVSLPACMGAAQPPLAALARHGTALLCVSCAFDLQRLFFRTDDFPQVPRSAIEGPTLLARA